MLASVDVDAVSEDRSARLLEAGLILASELSLPAVLQHIVDLAAELTGARYGALGVLGERGGLIDFITTGISPHERAAIGHLPVGRGILGVLIHDARPLRLADIAGDPRSVGFPPNHPRMRSFLGAPVMARGQVFGNLYMTEKRGRAEFDADDEQALVLLAAQAGVAIENARLYEEARRRAERLEAVRELADVILAGSELDPALALVARRARELVDADLAAVVVPGADTDALQVRAAEGAGAEPLLGQVLAADGALAGDVPRTGAQATVADLAGHARAAVATAVGGRPGPAVSVPLRVRGQPFGALVMVRAAGRASFTDQDVVLVETFAEQAAVAFEYIRAQSELRRMAVLEDRERIAGELHDGAIQALFAVGMRLQGTASRSPDADQRQRIEHAVGEIDRVIRDLRNYIFGLRPGVLADRQLDQALRQLVDDFQQRTAVTAVADIDPDVAAQLGSRAGDVVQLAREALSNVSRHAGAATCRVSLHRQDGGAVLEIDDDGGGFDPATVLPGQGLGNLRARAKRLGGALELTSVIGEGTTVRVELPL
jgi:signal transduction histidine kinase